MELCRGIYHIILQKRKADDEFIHCMELAIPLNDSTLGEPCQSCSHFASAMRYKTPSTRELLGHHSAGVILRFWATLGHPR